jgi:hypothetical protein
VRHLFLSAILACALILAIGSVSTIAAQSDSAPPANAASPAKQDPNRISADEIASANRPTAYDVVDHLRRQWLRKDMLTGEDVVIYMDEQSLGGADKLRDIPTVDVAQLQFLPHNDAVKRWGSDIKGSVIVVSRRR